jgi:hypothetical protein
MSVQHVDTTGIEQDATTGPAAGLPDLGSEVEVGYLRGGTLRGYVRAYDETGITLSPGSQPGPIGIDGRQSEVTKYRFVPWSAIREVNWSQISWEDSGTSR